VRCVIAGLGVQGYKRRHYAGEDYVASVDPKNTEAEFRDLKDVPLSSYDAVLACIPDQLKLELLRYCLSNGKHVLVEKPLWVERSEDVMALERLARERHVLLYTAYNHRFEPHFVSMRDLIKSGELGRIYSCRMFYGNGTARLVRNSLWRDEGAGVLPDLGSHLLDTCRFWFGNQFGEFAVSAVHRFENRAPDHVIISSEAGEPRIELEMTLCMWRNHFTCDILAEKGSAHIESLCKWGPTKFSVRTRILPAGRPLERDVTLVQPDPTWGAEYAHFKKLVKDGVKTDLRTDFWLQECLRRMSESVIQ
jgi:scyllo-inositol 2-dehydrogenase (NADP+)